VERKLEGMTANVTKLEENKVRLDVEVPPEAVRKGVEAKVRELGRQVRVPGFRPGKAPRRVIENRLGRDYIYMEALQEQLPTWYSQAVIETDLRPIDQPEINFDEALDEEEGFKFSATVEVRPRRSSVSTRASRSRSVRSRSPTRRWTPGSRSCAHSSRP
jgi:trigger factor